MNRTTLSTVAQLSNNELLARVKHLAGREREVTVLLIAHLAELDERRLYLAEGCASLFTYCTQILHLSEHAAYGRIAAARASRKFPVILESLSDGSVNLSTVCLLAPHLTLENHREVLDAAQQKTKRQVEELVAQLRPQPPVPDVIRRLPARVPATTHTPASSTAPQVVALGSPPDGNAPILDNGRRCTEEGFLEFHHVVPHAAGGPSTAENIHLRCRAHNGHEAELNFGSRMPLAVREARASYMHVTGQRRSLSCLGISATRSGPSSNSDKSCLNVRRWVRLSDMVFLSARGRAVLGQRRSRF